MRVNFGRYKGTFLRSFFSPFQTYLSGIIIRAYTPNCGEDGGGRGVEKGYKFTGRADRNLKDPLTQVLVYHASFYTKITLNTGEGVFSYRRIYGCVTRTQLSPFFFTSTVPVSRLFGGQKKKKTQKNNPV